MTPQPMTLEETRAGLNDYQSLIQELQRIHQRYLLTHEETRDLLPILTAALHHLEAGKQTEAQLDWLLNALNTKTGEELRDMSISAFWRGGVKLDRGDIYAEMQKEAVLNGTLSPTKDQA